MWWLRLWFLSSQHSSKYSDKTRRTPRSLRPGQSIREKTTQRSGCFCSIKQPSEQQQPFSVWDVELILPRFLSLCFFPPTSLSITISKKKKRKRKTATTPTVRAVNTICDGVSFFLYHLPSGPSEQPAELSSRKKKKNLVVDERQRMWNNSKTWTGTWILNLCNATESEQQSVFFTYRL